MPKKSRPSASRRRKGPKNVRYDFAAAPASEVTTDAPDAAAEAVEEEAPGAAYVRNVSPDTRAERHVSRDYTHVRNEVVRIAVLGGVLIIAIIVAGFFR